MLNIGFFNQSAKPRKQYKLFTAIFKVMKMVEKARLPLDMKSYYKEVDNSNLSLLEQKTIHNCSTAACVIGYASLDPNVKKIAKIRKSQQKPERVLSCLEREIGPLLADSIADPTSNMRLKSATFVLGEKRASSFKHLTNEDSSPADVLEYMEEVFDILNSKQNLKFSITDKS